MTEETTTTEIGEDTAGLKAKIKELLGDLKSAKNINKDMADRLEALESAQTDAADQTKSELDRERAKWERDKTKLLDANTKAESRLATLLIDNEISKAIAANGVLPHFVPAVTAMLKAGAKMENGEAVGADGSSLMDTIGGFFTSADAKHYVSAANNSGANATGSTAVAGKWGKPPEPHQMGDWAREAVANPVEFNARADSWNRPDLKV